jgi:dephospho-CoA kinase
MIVLGLTGSIGMGKSTAASLLRAVGCAVQSADAVVHRLLGPEGEAVAKVAAEFTTALEGDRIDRKILGELVFKDPAARTRLEAILHPLVRQHEQEKRKRAEAAGREFLVLEIPLLFETGAESRCDATLCVTAPAWLQKKRVMARAEMSPEKYAAILAAQMPDAEKRRRADYVVYSAFGHRALVWQLRILLGCLRRRFYRHP